MMGMWRGAEGYGGMWRVAEGFRGVQRGVIWCRRV